MHPLPTLLLSAAVVLTGSACARGPQAPAHGRLSSLSAPSSLDFVACAHGVPEEVCALCQPELKQGFVAVGDWCAEHDRPESQCLLCHPTLTFAPLPPPPAGADLLVLGTGGEDVGPLEALAVPGKVTVFDFHAAWCAPCREVEVHLISVLRARSDVAVRKLDVGTWETPLAKRHLQGVPSLPYVVVYGRKAQRVDAVSGLDLERLDRAILLGAQQ